MRSLAAALVLAVSALGGTAALAGERLVAQASSGSVALKVGSKKMIAVANITRVAVGNPDVADIRVAGGDSVEVTGRAAGSTQVTVWKQDGQKVSYQVSVSR